MNDITARQQAISLGFDYNCYLKNNPDLIDKWDHDLATHFILYGMNEGRIFQCPDTTVQPQTTPPATPADTGSNSDTGAPQPTSNKSKVALLALAVAAVYIGYKEKIFKTK